MLTSLGSYFGRALWLPMCWSRIAFIITLTIACTGSLSYWLILSHRVYQLHRTKTNTGDMGRWPPKESWLVFADESSVTKNVCVRNSTHEMESNHRFIALIDQIRLDWLWIVLVQLRYQRNSKAYALVRLDSYSQWGDRYAIHTWSSDNANDSSQIRRWNPTITCFQLWALARDHLFSPSNTLDRLVFIHISELCCWLCLTWWPLREQAFRDPIGSHSTIMSFIRYRNGKRMIQGSPR
jgi:hypothetical protein